MRALLLAALCFALSVIAHGSPIQEPITSLDHLTNVGVRIETHEFEDGSGISFRVSWKLPVTNDEVNPPRMDLILTTKDGADKPIHRTTRLQVRFTQIVDGILFADFTVSPSDLTDSQLWFRESQQANYYLNLNELKIGFPDLNLDPSAEDKNGEQGAPDAPPAPGSAGPGGSSSD